MKIALLILAAFVVLLALVLIIGAMLPRQHRVTRSITLARPAQEVYAVVRDFGAAASWRRDLDRVEVLDATHFREESKHGKVNYEVVEDIPESKLVTRIVDRNLGYSGSWTYEFLPSGSGTRVRVTENGEVSNVFFRFMSRFVFGQTKTLDDYLNSLGAKFGEKVTPH